MPAFRASLQSASVSWLLACHAATPELWPTRWLWSLTCQHQWRQFLIHAVFKCLWIPFYSHFKLDIQTKANIWLLKIITSFYSVHTNTKKKIYIFKILDAILTEMKAAICVACLLNMPIKPMFIFRFRWHCVQFGKCCGWTHEAPTHFEDWCYYCHNQGIVPYFEYKLSLRLQAFVNIFFL